MMAKPIKKKDKSCNNWRCLSFKASKEKKTVSLIVFINTFIHIYIIDLIPKNLILVISISELVL